MDTSLCFMLQARVGSTRLPQKMILPFFEDKNILELIILKLQQNFPEIPIVLATSKQSENDVLETIAKRMGCKVFRGSENDVLQRFIDAAETFQFDKVIRVCADNPFLDVAELHRLISFVEKDQSFDYVSFTINGNPSIKTHFGFWTEYVTLQALKKVNLLTDDSFYHEHVTNYIYGHDDSFLVKFIEANPVLEGKKNIRMTLDTLVDFNMLSEIYQKLLGVYGKDFGINEIVSFLDENEEYKRIMTNQIIENSK
jgi:spore coat polysaccharide biosynthesis protein SpsF (cytidylyltransferase family)